MSDVKLPYWIQRADFSSEGFDPVTFNEAFAVIDRHNWSGELALQKSMEAKGEEECPPGIGFHRDHAVSLDTLHLMPWRGRSWFGTYFFPDPVWQKSFWDRVFGGPGSPGFQKGMAQIGKIPPDKMKEILSAFFANDHNTIIGITGST